ncbi:class I SAM-dependent methyltransferase [Altericroceibacterium spongiae]|uniref:Class I SAM-dependent methyltransferase n=1 Tax=Altericroceibacterium spongiae TaxID=2320269 RepID=A0A420EQR1_9SPHN|nr:cyclopropane-fatty-acyl-phospholipid synthase family protein [Altericroceibacterium spongiae]RKF23028.1 class I SAM-dependent methyltransferase [Altericroceibacterium spongiae]
MSAKLIDRILSRIVKKGRLVLRHADGRVVDFGREVPGYPDLVIRFTDEHVTRDLIRDPRLGAGECYMDGRIVIEVGEVMDFVQLIQSNARWEKRGRLNAPTIFSKMRHRASYLAHSFNNAASSRRNVSHHYDVGNDLYELMLDSGYMQYSCGYWPSDDISLEEAQVAKLAHIAAKLALEPGQRVLDIGCGWGGMAIYLAEHHDVEVLGITLSSEQLALARQRAEKAGVADRVQFELIDYRDLARRGLSYDRIVSVGMFEHVGTPQFDGFFRACANLLSEEGVMLLHTIGRMGGPGRTDAFTDKYIFPGGYIPALSETVASSEKSRLIASDVETLRLHYAKTLREWYKRCMENREAIIGMYDERFFRMWTFYLSGATAAFESGGMCNYQIQYVRDRHALPLTRNYMLDK